MATRTRDNSNLGLKLAVRRWLLSQVDTPQVLDLYCGASGQMWQGVWREATTYLGVDKNTPHSHATTMRMSAERAVQSLDLDTYNLFDVDTYSSPWAVARKVIKRRGPGQFGLALTVGEARGLRNGNSNEIVRRSIGASGLSDYRLLGRYQDLVTGLMIRSLIEIPGISLSAGRIGKGVGNNPMVYIGLLLDNRKVGRV